MHVSPDDLAGSVIEGDDALDTVQRAHLRDCERCRHELDQLHRTAQTLAESGPREIIVPGAPVWGRIAAELRQESGPSPAVVRAIGPRSAQRHAQPRGGREPGRVARPRPRLPVLIAAVVGVLVGAGGAIVADRVIGPRTEVVASTDLAALPGHSGSGSAELVRAADRTQLRVTVSGGVSGGEFRELWLINTDGKRMYALGVLPPSGAGTYTVPAQLGAALDGFTIVDVSIEPYDGDARHSLESQVRGTLPV